MNSYEYQQIELRTRELNQLIEREIERRYHWKRQRFFWLAAAAAAILGVLLNGLPGVIQFGQALGYWQ